MGRAGWWRWWLALVVAVGPRAVAVAQPPEKGPDKSAEGAAEKAAEPPKTEPGWSGGFETDALRDKPVGWFVPSAVRSGGWTAVVTEGQARTGKRCVVLARTAGDAAAGQSFGNLMRTMDATPYRGKRVVFKGAVRVDGTEDDDHAALWMRVDLADGNLAFFDNMRNRPIRWRQWAEYSIVAEVANDAAYINVGLMVFGGGAKAWLDDVSVQIAGERGEGDEGARPLTDRGLDNLVAFTRVLGYVRYFHPSDEAAGTDWDSFAIAGVRTVELAASAEELSGDLERQFKPIAPTAEFRTASFEAALKPESLRPAGTEPTAVMSWMHQGLGNNIPNSPYASRRQRRELVGAPGGEEDAPRIGEAVTAALPGGVWVRVPLSLYVAGTRTLPASGMGGAGGGGGGGALPNERPAGWEPSGRDRSTRLADVALLWNVLEHFYPYFDVVETDWSAALPEALRSGATDQSEWEFLETLRRMVARLHDGHGNAWHASDAHVFVMPLRWDWVEGRLVVTEISGDPAFAEGPRRGDAVVSIDGAPIAELRRKAEVMISAATPQWLAWRTLEELGRRDSTKAVSLEVERADGTKAKVSVTPVQMNGQPKETRPEKIAQVRPGIWYVDIDRITDDDFTAALPDLSKATGLIFDLRGYPGKVSTVVLAHLTDKPLSSAQWHVPLITRPDRQGMKFQQSNWFVQPAESRLTGRAAFIIDGRAISYAETYMGIVEHYKLAEIVGSATAGTNGNVNPTSLPGGYGVAWTGMRVLKHHGSQHHGIGILPTVPAARTIEGVAAGKDEYLEKAIEVVSEKKGEPEKPAGPGGGKRSRRGDHGTGSKRVGSLEGRVARACMNATLESGDSDLSRP